MNILLPYSFLKEYIDIDLTPKELSKQLSLHSMAVERIIPENEFLTDHVVLGEIKSVDPHPNADRLKLTTVSDGKEEFKVVCGGSNLEAGMKIAFAKVGAKVLWHGEGEPVELGHASIRGEDSFGMICDNAELALSDTPDPDHKIADYSHLEAPVGTPLAQALGLDDVVFDIEITTNRIDSGSVIGMAREVAAILGKDFNEPSFVDEAMTSSVSDPMPVSVDIQHTEGCRGFNVLVVKNVKVGPSPDWLQRRLRAMGHTPINNVVDITNYVMREVGNPLHAFDYNNVADGHLIVRAAKKGESFDSLDKNETVYKTTTEDMVVADKNRMLSLAGVKGGASSMIAESTTTVLLEAASWNPLVIRRMQMRSDIFSDAGSYFTKGVSPQMAEQSLYKAAKMIVELAGGEIASEHVHEGYTDYAPTEVSMRISQAEKYVGIKLDIPTVVSQLNALGLTVTSENDETLTCQVPHWRQYDVAIEEDLIEEVARMYGYHNIEDALPSGELPMPEFNKHLSLEYKLKEISKGMGLTEVFTYSMVSEDLLKLSNRKVKEAVRLLNPLDDDHAVMRTRLLPSVLEVVATNQGVMNSQMLFELTHVYAPQGKDELPKEESEMAFAFAGGNEEEMFRLLKGMVLRLLDELGHSCSVELIPNDKHDVFATHLTVMLGKEEMGALGVVKPKIAKALGIKTSIVACELSIASLINVADKKLTFKPIPKYPSVNRDLSILVDEQIPWQAIYDVAMDQGGDYLRSVELFDIYKHEGKKSLAFHLVFRSEDHTLEAKEIDPLVEKIIDNLKKEVGAELRG